MPAQRLAGVGVLQVEPTDHCNLSCSMCAPHHEAWPTVHGVAKGYLDPDLWDQLVDGFVAEDLHFDHIIFQWLGDPSLHPQLPRLIGRAAQGLVGRVGYLRVDTNAIRLGPPRIDALLDAMVAAGPDAPPLLVVVTLDAHSAPTYQRVKGADRLAQVRRHVRHLVRQRKAVGARVNLQLQFVVQQGNSHEAGDFLAYWGDLLSCQGEAGRWHDEVMFKRLSVSGGQAGQAEADALYERTLAEAGIRGGAWPGPDGPVQVATWERRPWQDDDAHSGARTACPGLWLTPVIRHDGALLMCCADLQGELILGKLAEEGFRALWEGPRATRTRMDHLAGRFSGVCAGCGGINWYDLDPDRVQATRARARALSPEPR